MLSIRKMIVSVLLMLTAIWRLNEATSCTAVTGNTCQKTNYVTGTCAQATCACIDGYEPNRLGCIKILNPVSTVIARDGRSPEATSKGSGEVLAGGRINLTCAMQRSPITYVWSKDNVDIAGQSGSQLELSSVSANQNGQYRCKAKLDASDYLSNASEPVTVKVVPVGGSFMSRPVVVGMPKRAMANSVITLECTNTPSGLGLIYDWFVGGVNMNAHASTYSLTITDNVVSKNVTCKVTQSQPQVNVTLALPESSPVDTPSALTEDISGVAILDPRGGTSNTVEVGVDFSLTCTIIDTDLALPAGSPAYRWTKDSTAIGNARVYSKKAATADAGVYQCFVTVGTRPEKASDPLTLTVVGANEIIGRVTTEVIPSGAQPLLGGYISMKCIAEVKNLTSVRYQWINHDKVVVYDQTDALIQINGAAAKDVGFYQCQVFSELDFGEDVGVSITTPVTADTVTPNVPTSDKPDKDFFGVGNTYNLTCSSSFDSPGVSYRWMEKGQVISGATSKTYTIQAKPGATQYSCQIVFNNITSKPSAVLIVDAKNIIRTIVALAGPTVSGSTIRPLTGVKVILECKVTTGASSSATVSYAWLRNDQKLQNQTAATYEFTAGAASDGEIRCSGTQGTESLNSDKVVVSAVATVEAPTLEVFNATMISQQPVYSEGGSYTLVCTTSSHTDSIRYTWLRNGTVISGSTGRSYTISNARRGAGGDSGVYKCNATQGSSTATSSNEITITIGEPGRPCRYVTDCQGAQYGTSCTNGRCECASGYTANGNTCSSGMRRLTASVLLLLICACLVRRM